MGVALVVVGVRCFQLSYYCPYPDQLAHEALGWLEEIVISGVGGGASCSWLQYG